ncbi:16S rRNA (uracil(1498)-N(3))-methyltransferase [Sulfurovum sp. zt1-1]|uniref:Ribosomal RNA small subunit methyltransferase E n=1 Tax=Sulfurovum zhangzhouensis TaxID=3019067 RepID=A0ABT7R0G7_9BACT|nr:16S rRNA (uracil(1498)-N(3))-methyltransferase [Sulfurovum zhangzhouensis]MDM5272274.1 16S rRNA (uracil(1498)-N(3))-methyltransferase [Sulfurovum zhangzhouensis]
MLYLYNTLAGQPSLILEGDDHRYIFKVRRHKVDDILYLRNLEDGLIHRYLITQMDKRNATLILQESKILEVKAKHDLHIGWCMIDPKSVEKVLPSLNEMGVAKITFIYCDRSQKSFKPDFKRWEKILLNSSQQSGRSEMMQFDISENLKAFIAENPQSYLLNFSEHTLSSGMTIDTIVIGCEGGLTEKEVALFAQERVVGFDTPLVLKSESAACAVASKILL